MKNQAEVCRVCGHEVITAIPLSAPENPATNQPGLAIVQKRDGSLARKEHPMKLRNVRKHHRADASNISEVRSKISHYPQEYGSAKPIQESDKRFRCVAMTCRHRKKGPTWWHVSPLLKDHSSMQVITQSKDIEQH